MAIRTWWNISLFAVALSAGQAQAVLVYVDNGASPPTATRLLTAPVDDRGWSTQGNWGDGSETGSGTPIAPHYFITAKHFAGTTFSFTYNNVASIYTPIASFSDPDSDLRIVQVQETFPTWASLYLKNDEVTKGTTIFGRSFEPGTAVTVSSVVRGWQWGGNNGPRSWGLNVVSSTADFSLTSQDTLLRMTFDAAGSGDHVNNEGTLAGWDSGGGTFIQDTDGQWKLAGVNYGVDVFRADPSTGPNLFSLFDARGFYEFTDPTGNPDVASWPSGSYQQVADPGFNEPAGSYASRISARLDWIGSIVPSAVPEPSSAVVLLAGSMLFTLRRRAR